MTILLLILAGLAGLASFVCWLIILISAFQDEIWKGVVSLLCGLYFLYYAIAEYESDNKWPIVIFALGGGAISAGILGLAGKS